MRPTFPSAIAEQDYLPAGDGLCSLEQRARSGAGHRHHARQRTRPKSMPSTQPCAMPRSKPPDIKERQNPTSGLEALSSPRMSSSSADSLSVREGSMVLRDASGLVVDSLNYGGLVDPWAAEGYQATSGSRAEWLPCAAASGPRRRTFRRAASATNTSAGRFPDGADTDSNCNDFLTQAAATLSAASQAGAMNIKVASVEGFESGQKVMIDTGANVRERYHRKSWHGWRHHSRYRHRCRRDSDPCCQTGRFSRRPDHHH